MKAALEIRSATLAAIREFFRDRDFLEAETPVRVPAPALELHIDAEPSGDSYLRTSPELYLKRLLCDGAERVYEMGPCFRRGERGRLHSPEYTMLEWYRTGADYLGVLEDTRELVTHVCGVVHGGTTLHWDGSCTDIGGEWETRTVSDTFMEHAGWDPVRAYDADRFDLDLVNKVEPALPRDRPLVLMDYPEEAGALARIRPGEPRVAERWELYVAGMEIANAYSELTDAGEQLRRFRECADMRRRAGKDVYPVDRDFIAALERGMPECAGVALGVDRLVMLLAGATRIDDVRVPHGIDD